MCGIIGIISRNGTLPMGRLATEGLQKLEYRGYDSCGVAVVDGEKLTVRKNVGRVACVAEKENFMELQGTVSCSHSRWSTHGQVTKQNAHPHTSCKGDIAVVHNGIIENYQELRKELEERGHVFSSQTDTEVIPHLIEENIEGELLEAARKAALRLEGSYAFLAVKAGEEKLVAARKDSPLLLGIADNAFFAASDATPFISSTREAMFLNDGEIALMQPGNMQVFATNTGVKLEKQIEVLRWDAQSAEKNNYEHFVLKEIDEQPQAIIDALAQNDEELEKFAWELRAAKRVVFTACGTSRHGALVARYAIEQISGVHCDVMMASEYGYFAGNEGPGTLVIAISQSGETADVIDALKKAKGKGAKIFCFVNVAGSTIDRLSERRLYFNCGPEIGVAATKSFTAQLVLGYLLAFAAAGKLKEGRELLSSLPQLVRVTLDANKEKCRQIAQKIALKQHAYFIARGINFAIALEGALKMKECSYVHAEGMPAGELKHGTLALVEEGTPVVVINPEDYTKRETHSNAVETKARGAWVVGIVNEEDGEYDENIKIPSCEPLFYPLLANLPLQLLAYYTAVAKKVDPDKPRNLAKSCTVK